MIQTRNFMHYYISVENKVKMARYQEDWRKHVSNVTVDTVPADTILPIDTYEEFLCTTIS